MLGTGFQYERFSTGTISRSLRVTMCAFSHFIRFRSSLKKCHFLHRVLHGLLTRGLPVTICPFRHFLQFRAGSEKASFSTKGSSWIADSKPSVTMCSCGHFLRFQTRAQKTKCSSSGASWIAYSRPSRDHVLMCSGASLGSTFLRLRTSREYWTRLGRRVSSTGR